MKLKNSMELPDVAARLLLEYKMRLISSTSSVLYATASLSKMYCYDPCVLLRFRKAEQNWT